MKMKGGNHTVLSLSEPRDQIFPVRDALTEKELKALALQDVKHYRSKVYAVFTGKMRNPKAGEWYLSGAVIEAYRAKADITCTRAIATLVAVDTEQVTNYTVTAQL